MRIDKILLAFPLFLLLVSCSANNTNGNISSVATRLQVTRVDLIPQNGFTPFQEKINDAVMVQSLYQAALKLPTVPHGENVKRMCFNDQGIRYELNFYPTTLPMHQMVINPADCQTLIIGKSDERQMNGAFLSLLTQTVKVRFL
jgi:hypothetical protein